MPCHGIGGHLFAQQRQRPFVGTQPGENVRRKPEHEHARELSPDQVEVPVRHCFRDARDLRVVEAERFAINATPLLAPSLGVRQEDSRRYVVPDASEHLRTCGVLQRLGGKDDAGEFLAKRLQPIVDFAPEYRIREEGPRLLDVDERGFHRLLVENHADAVGQVVDQPRRGDRVHEQIAHLDTGVARDLEVVGLGAEEVPERAAGEPGRELAA